MAMSTATLYLSFLLASFLLIQSLPATSADKNFVDSTCNSTSNPDFCSKTLLSDPQSVNITSIDGLAVIALNIAIKSADSASSQANDWSNDDKYKGLPEEAALNQCTQTYSAAADDLRDAQQDLPDKSFTDAKSQTNDAGNQADACEKAFADNNVTSLMSAITNVFKDQDTLCWDLIDLLDSP